LSYPIIFLYFILTTKLVFCKHFRILWVLISILYSPLQLKVSKLRILWSNFFSNFQYLNNYRHCSVLIVIMLLGSVLKASPFCMFNLLILEFSPVFKLNNLLTSVVSYFFWSVRWPTKTQVQMIYLCGVCPELHLLLFLYLIGFCISHVDHLSKTLFHFKDMLVSYILIRMVMANMSFTPTKTLLLNTIMIRSEVI